MPEALPFRAHARLLTMLGDQLIKNERIALVELVKNAYDADASRVTVDFIGFGDNFESSPSSVIVITDDGDGMTDDVIKNAWMNPATPSKAITKSTQPVTKNGRALQGEKGIGRFATFKLGSQVLLTTRHVGHDKEATLLVDISDIDERPGFRPQQLDYFLEDVSASFETGVPLVFDGGPTRPSHGTRLEIRSLRARWTADLVNEAFADLDRMQPQLWSESQSLEERASFSVAFLRDGVDLNLGAERVDEFQAVLERAVLRVSDGRYDDQHQEIRFFLDGREVRLSLADPEIRGLRRFRERFGEDLDQWVRPECGPFGFEFFIFDFGPNAPAKHWLDRDDKEILKQHRVYLYRDGIRVYPYGDPQDDWLQVDAIRGTESARSMFSNDQTVGFVTITQAMNPELRDKTNREGLLETGRATGDFVALIQSVLAYLRSKPYAQYAAANRRVKEKSLRDDRFDAHLRSLRADVNLPERAVHYLDALENAVLAERDLSALQLARTEQLAGVGLSVETASHDLIAAGARALRSARQVLDGLRLLDLRTDPVFAQAASVVTQLEFVNARFKDVQGLFVSTRQKSGELDIGSLVRRVRAMYAGLHKQQHIEFQIVEPFDLRAVSTEAAVLQCLINLVDNATYWLMTESPAPRAIRAYSNDSRSLVVTDNGPGVKEQDEPFIFEPFYSGKGDSGKGLGLYIARQNGARGGFDIELEVSGSEADLPGATFRVTFDESKAE